MWLALTGAVATDSVILISVGAINDSVSDTADVEDIPTIKYTSHPLLPFILSHPKLTHERCQDCN